MVLSLFLEPITKLLIAVALSQMAQHCTRRIVVLGNRVKSKSLANRGTGRRGMMSRRDEGGTEKTKNVKGVNKGEHKEQ